jgi:hypothetical protein
MKLIPKSRYKAKRKSKASLPPPEETKPEIVSTEPETAAVISLALNLYIQQMREYEDAIITIQKVMKPYSPWSSKIYGLRQTPNYIPGLRTRLK